MDQSFNCITGKNGSGKSNILDAITFVLGNNKPKEMRVAQMKGLISSNGKLEKASVTLVFDNRNKDLSPPLFKEDDIISVTREQFSDKSIYLINGKKVTNEKAKQLFLSVHLNINNPHFLIKQGEIVKMMKMKP